MSDEKQEIARPINGAAVSKANVDPAEKDLFDDVFGEDREKEQARLLFKKKLEEDNAKKRKAKQAQSESNQSGVKDAENVEKAGTVEKETISEKENLNEKVKEDSKLFETKNIPVSNKAKKIGLKPKKPKMKLKGELEDSEIAKIEKEKPVVESSGPEIPLAEKLKKMSEDLEKIQPKKSKFRQNADAVFVGKKDSDDPFPMKPEPPPKPPKPLKPPKPIKPKMAEDEIESSFADFNSEDRRKIKEVILKKAQNSLAEIPKTVEDEEDEIKEIGIREEPLSEEEKMEREIEESKENAIAEKIGLKPELSFLDYPEKNAVFIGRKKSVFEKYHDEAALYLGTIDEKGTNESKKVLLDSLNPHVVFVCGARGSGKCLHGDTLITLENGLIVPIKELENIEGNVFGLNHSLKIETLHREGFYKRKVNKLLNLALRNGKKIKLTPEHPLLTINGWIPAENLPIGSRIATPRVLNSFGKQKMKECDVKLLAYLIAEGHLSNQFVLFSNNDEKIVSDFKQSVGKFDENLRIELHSKAGCFRIAQKKKKIDISHIVRNEKGQFTNKSFVIASKSSLMQWLESINVYGKLSAEKFVPNEIMQLEKNQLSLFLNRLFSCDGSIYRINKRKNNWAICYASSSEKLLREVQHLLLRFGILSKSREKNAKYNGKTFKVFELVVYGENVIKFIEEIGFFGEKELKAETAFNEMTGIKRNPNTDTIPKDVWNSFKPKNWAELGRQIGYSSPKSLSHSVNYAPSREKLLKLSQIEENVGIQLLANSDIYWDEITEVKEEFGEFDVYDISVPSQHNFVANDIIVHNSYVLGIIAEELALKNKNVGIIVIDPIGVFWSMRFPNKEERELALLAKYDLLPQGLNNLKVFIPLGLKDDVPRSTYDATFAIQPSLLTTDDWCLTFGIDRFSPTGLLLEKALGKVKQGFRNKDKVQIKARGEKFSLEDLIMTLETDEELNSSDRGYKADSIRALSSRFDAAKGWGIFSEKGTPLSELSRENQLAIIDTSFLEDNVSALVIGILARRILAARKISTRRAAAEKLKTADVDEALELEIPPTWLFIDEAHTLIPSGNVKTPATNALVEYVKQGRQPGCSLVFATQQPSAIDTKVLSQLDIIMAHKLIFDDDIKAIFKRTPAIIPAKYKASSFIKTLPVGTAVTGDRREETSRAFIMKIRPRMSQHEGREAETAELSKELAPDKAKSLAVEMINSKLDKEGMLDINTIENLIQTLSSRYKAPIQLNETLDELEKRGKIIDPKAKTVSVKGWNEETELEKQQLKAVQEAKEAKEQQKSTVEMVKEGVLVPLKKFFGKSDEKNLKEKAIVQKMLEEKGIEQLSENPPVELLAFSKHLNEKQAIALFDKLRQKKFLGFIGEEEYVDNVSAKHLPVYKIKYHVYDSPETFFVGEGYVDAVKGEFIHYKKGSGIVESKGLILSKDIEKNEKPVLNLLAERQRMDFGEICRITKSKPEEVKQILENLIAKDFVKEERTGGKEAGYSLKKQLDLPKEALHALMTSMKRVSVKEETSISIKNAKIDKNQLNDLLKKLWENSKLKEIETLYLPIYEAELKKKNGEKRTITIEAVSGNVI